MGPRSIDRGIRFRDGLFTFWCTASMGPRSIDRGIPGFMTLAGGSGFQLQWGRDQLIAELARDFVNVRLRTVLQWGRDQLIAELRAPGDSCGKLFRFNGAAIN